MDLGGDRRVLMKCLLLYVILYGGGVGKLEGMVKQKSHFGENPGNLCVEFGSALHLKMQTGIKNYKTRVPI